MDKFPAPLHHVSSVSVPKMNPSIRNLGSYMTGQACQESLCLERMTIQSIIKIKLQRLTQVKSPTPTPTPKVFEG
jgi:hypothetical protein